MPLKLFMNVTQKANDPMIYKLANYSVALLNIIAFITSYSYDLLLIM